jgi:hypothetical protein
MTMRDDSLGAVDSGVPAGRRATALAAGDPGQAGVPTNEHAVTSFLGRLVERFQRCEQYRGEIMARLRAEHPRLVVVSMYRGYGGQGYLPKSYGQAWYPGARRSGGAHGVSP